MEMLQFILNNKDYLEDLITRSTYHSNAIEGSTLTYAETYAILYNDNSFKIEGKEPREIYEAINHKKALELVFKNLQDNEVFDERFIKILNESINRDIKDTEGYISGNLNLNGTIDKPSILGKVQFNEVGLTVAKTGSNFRKINDAIDFTSQGIELNKFKINDVDGNTLTLNGKVATETYRDFAFDLTANARDFKVVNSEKANDALMYGVLAVNANLNIKGDLDLPVVDGTLKVTDKTNFTFVLPQSSPSLQEREGIVEFIDQDQVTLQETIKTEQLTSDTKIKGYDVNVNIEIDKDAKTSIIIDKVNGDFVEIQGEAQLTGGMDPSGKTTLVGVYEVESGSYEMTVSVLKRKFDIEKGSTITWTGEPSTALLNITAVYKTETAPIDLV